MKTATAPKPRTVADYRARQLAKLTAQLTAANTVSPDYRSRYHSTPDTCECPAQGHNPAEPCKHRRLEQLRADLAQHIRRHVAAVTSQGGDPILATRDVLYSTLDFYWERMEDEAIGTRFDVIAKNFVARSIDRFEARHGLATGETSHLIRLADWTKARVLGRTTLTA